MWPRTRRNSRRFRHLRPHLPNSGAGPPAKAQRARGSSRAQRADCDQANGQITGSPRATGPETDGSPGRGGGKGEHARPSGKASRGAQTREKQVRNQQERSVQRRLGPEAEHGDHGSETEAQAGKARWMANHGQPGAPGWAGRRRRL